MMKYLLSLLYIPRFFLALVLLSPFLHVAYALDINTATADELRTLKGIGTKRAEAIIRYREENGPIRSTEELLSVPGVGVSIVSANDDELTFGSNKSAALPN